MGHLSLHSTIIWQALPEMLFFDAGQYQTSPTETETTDSWLTKVFSDNTADNRSLIVIDEKASRNHTATG